ncbi:MAG: hypothetical protein LBS39_01260 [Campylobacteraceae bacterium]|jgi:tRNA A-37 threonylcarbamoyl transferase component Bud32|nr:hypothetical protein [Campylobacteraceae bacterium]
MIYPKSNEYRAAFQHIKDTLTDEILKNGIVKRNILGPQVISGNFAYIFEIMSQYRIKYAVRCFQYDIKDRKERYKAISEYLKKLGSVYFVDFEYQSEGVIVNGIKFPVIKMAWAEGELLGDFIKNNYANRFKIKNLISSIQKLARFIEKNNFAHGDIQTGNIIVSNNGRTLKLIDYDGMYVNDLKGFGNAECGVPNFQHPKRDKAWSCKLDRFSFITLYTALLALRDRHYLWDETDSDTDAILFREQDFIDPDNSAVFKKLREIKHMRKYIHSFEYICKGSFRNIPSLDNFIKKNTITIRHTSILVPIASIVIISCAAYIYHIESNGLNKIISFFTAIKENDTLDNKLQQSLNRYNIKEYGSTIYSLKSFQSRHSGSMDTDLSLIELYAVSGFDDNELYKLALPLYYANVKDKRLYFALAAYHWRADNMDKARIFVNVLKQDLPEDAILKKLVLLLDEAVRINTDSYESYYNMLNLDKISRGRFAKAMISLETDKMYKLMKGMYNDGFIGFSSKHKFNVNFSFDEWFRLYDAYNAAKGIKDLTSIGREFSNNHYLTYHLILNIVKINMQGKEGNCVLISDKYAQVASMLGREADIINPKYALEYANRLMGTSFSKAYAYYALGMAHYANSNFKAAQEAISQAIEIDYNNGRISVEVEERLKNIQSSMECRRSSADFQM